MCMTYYNAGTLQTVNADCLLTVIAYDCRMLFELNTCDAEMLCELNTCDPEQKLCKAKRLSAHVDSSRLAIGNKLENVSKGLLGD